MAFKVLLKDVVNDNLPYDWSLKTVNMGFRISKEKKNVRICCMCNDQFPQQWVAQSSHNTSSARKKDQVHVKNDPHNTMVCVCHTSSAR